MWAFGDCFGAGFCCVFDVRECGVRIFCCCCSFFCSFSLSYFFYVFFFLSFFFHFFLPHFPIFIYLVIPFFSFSFPSPSYFSSSSPSFSSSSSSSSSFSHFWIGIERLSCFFLLLKKKSGSHPMIFFGSFSPFLFL